MKLDSFINTLYTTSNAYPINPTSIARRDNGLEKRENICETIPGGKHKWDRFTEEIMYLSEQLDTAISSTMESNWVFPAMHPGHAPQDLVKPGGDDREAYRRSSTNMQSSVDVISKHEIRKVKCCKET